MAGAALLLGANFYGTLAATRALSRAGLEVAIADENRRARALHSRHVETLTCRASSQALAPR